MVAQTALSPRQNNVGCNDPSSYHIWSRHNIYSSAQIHSPKRHIWKHLTPKRAVPQPVNSHSNILVFFILPSSSSPNAKHSVSPPRRSPQRPPCYSPAIPYRSQCPPQCPTAAIPPLPPPSSYSLTKVPGILSISRPLRADSPRQQHPHGHPRHSHRSPKPKLAQPYNRSPQPIQDGPGKLAQEKQSPDVTSPVVERPSAHPPTPILDKSPRGRQTKAPKDKGAARNSSIHGQSRRNNPNLSPIAIAILRQTLSIPSLPAQTRIPTTTSRPPFPSSSGITKLPPILAVPPSGKYARRRNHIAQPPATPSPAPRPVPVPRGKQPAHRNNLSRSAPNPRAFPRIEKRRASATDFPVCDDTTDVEDSSPPSTPTRESPAGSAWQRLSLDGPRTAPLSSFNSFSFATLADSTPSRPRHHHRTPSEGVFNMSFDEDMSTTSDASEELKKLFGFPPKRFGSVGASTTRAGKDKAGFFASSVFQNSPSPDELPPPAF
ncbi:hypothetical protein JVT61DRAFT_15313 [Boletus reticuloceps]|uniref:Uncharacterized protein n=1 Tax=Boletus reticuloceps TaxID=495285 RepID=A0A8I2YSV4_9AGAM|nr:hypothetical protein JVT61DRAFT_15313 [Boletus reticuloceps]